MPTFEELAQGMKEFTERAEQITEVPRRSTVRAAPSTRSSRRHGRPPAEHSWKLADAKHELMTRYGVSEPVVHTMLQRFAMEGRMPLEEACDMIRLGLMALDHLRASDGQAAE